MKHKSIISILFYLVLSICSSAQTTFQNYITGIKFSSNPSISKTNDSGFIINNGNLTKGDSLGNIEWIKKINPVSNIAMAISYVHQTMDGGYAIAGSFDTTGQNYNSNFFLSKTDSAGNILWSKSYGGALDDGCSSMQQTSDGGFILAGGTIYANNYCGLIVRTDMNGDTLWTKIFSNVKDISKIIQTRSGGFLFGGYTSSLRPPSPDPFLIMTDSMGNIIWSKIYFQIGPASLNSLCQMSDDEFIMLIRAGGPTSTIASLMKINGDGNIIWTKFYSSTDYYWPRNVNIAQDGGIILTSSYSVPGYLTREDIFFMKTDSAGNLAWNRIFSSGKDETAGDAISMNDGTYLIAGSLSQNSIGGFYLIKADSLGSSLCFESQVNLVQTDSLLIDTNLTTSVNSGCLVNSFSISTDPVTFVTTDACLFLNVEQIGEESISVYPNPSNGKFRISAKNDFPEGTIRIFDSQMKKIVEKSFAGSSAEFDLGDIPNGIYFLVITDGIKILTKKLVVNR